MDKTAGTIITAKREEGFSLNKLEKITGKNRSSIMRWQRDEARIPNHVAEKLAAAFYKKKKDIDDFIAVCQRGNKNSEEAIKAAKHRRSELAKASRAFKGVVRVAQEQVNALQDLGDAFIIPHSKLISVSHIYFAVDIESKKTGETVLRFAPKEGLIQPVGTVWRKLTPTEYLRINRANVPILGKYALLDLMKKTIEKSDVFSVGTKNQLTIISTQDLKEEIERLKAVRENFSEADGVDIAEALESTIAHFQFWETRANNGIKSKDLLIRGLDAFCKKIDAL